MTDYSELKRLAEAAQNDCGDYVALNDYGMAVPPAVVLGLIDDLLCPTCKGSGEGWVISDGGPDAHHIQVDCPECFGPGTMLGAYQAMKIQRDSQIERTVKAGGDLLFMRAELDQLKDQNKNLSDLLECSQGDMRQADKLITERNRLLDAIPACPVHGQCVPYAIEWVEKAILMMRELKADNEVARMLIKEMDLLFGRYILAMRAALIEENAEKGMEWIYNLLAGPGELPPEGETDAQAYFDREIVAVEKVMDAVLAFHNARRKGKENCR